jgi:hypothetical protein
MARLLLLLSLGVSSHASNIVYSDTHWNDTAGERIEAHAAGMLQSPGDQRWYWYGESKKDSLLASHGVNCYSAPTIAGPWKNEGQVLSQSQIVAPGAKGPFVVERPKVLYNAKTKKYVMWFHLDDAGYKYRHVGTATADNPQGPFSWSRAFQPDGIPSLDMNLFRDPLDGQAYFIRSCDNAFAGISRLSDDYLSSTGLISNHSKFEGMSLLRLANGTYYMMTSHLTGWSPNPLMLFRAEGPTLDDPRWVDMGNPTGSPTSFNTQPTYVVQYKPKTGDPYFVYMSDDWVHCPNADGSQGPLVNACYTWLPIRFLSHSVELEYKWSWDLDNPWGATPPGPAPPGPAPSAPTPAPKPCAAAPKPSVGALIGVAACSGGGAALSWNVTVGAVGPINVKGAQGLCLAPPSGGQVLRLAACTGGEDQHWQLDNAVAGPLKHPATNNCLDIQWCGATICADRNADLFTCKPSSDKQGNQKLTLNASTGELAMQLGGFTSDMCLAACVP